MSMISAQCDDLRKTADELQGVINKGHNYMWPEIATVLHYVQQELRSAAEAIDKRTTELDFQIADNWRLTAENESLKEQNAKLRELVIRMRPICIQGTRCTFADKLYISKAMEELGIEVDG